jgi:ABC-type transport system involved in multi-copper enzyme maturation permease subunit
MKKAVVLAKNEFMKLLYTKKVIFVVTVYIILFLVCIKVSEYISLFSFFLPALRPSIHFILLLPFYCGIFALPLVCFFSVYDTISQEFDNKSLKYIIYRIPRKEIILGKFIAPTIMIILINLILYLGTLIYLSSKGLHFWWTGLGLFFGSSILTLFFISIGLLSSVIFNTPQKSIRYGLLTLILLYIIPAFDKLKLDWISPYGFAKAAVEFAKMNITQTYILWAFLIYSVILLITTITIFEKKDLY